MREYQFGTGDWGRFIGRRRRRDEKLVPFVVAPPQSDNGYG